MIYAKPDYSDQYKKSLIGKLPSWVWMIIFGLLSVFGNYFLNQVSVINLLPYQFETASGAAELGNLIWLHFVLAPFSVLIFEIIVSLYSQLAVVLSKGSLGVPRKDFGGIFRAFYCIAFLISGLIQIMCFYNSLTVVWFSIFGLTIPRLLVMFIFFLYIKKKYLTSENTHITLKSIFIPYFIFELVTLVYALVV